MANSQFSFCKIETENGPVTGWRRLAIGTIIFSMMVLAVLPWFVGVAWILLWGSQ
jgi:hypothetical protein